MIRENEVTGPWFRREVAENDVGLMSRAVRQTPLTATLSPVRNSFGVFGASTVIPPVLAMLLDLDDLTHFFNDAGGQ